ncbi:MAG: acetyl-CoA carboxylase biotin carboxyl carrier protein [Polyangiales bacterium]
MKRPSAPAYDLDELKLLMRAFRRYDLTELEIQRGDTRFVLRRNAQAPRGVEHREPAAEHGPSFPLPTAGKGDGRFSSTAPGAPEAVDEDADSTFITSPLVGTFYRAPSPDAKAFVEVGSVVGDGTTVCIIEAMKLMNEIPAETQGVISEVLVENGRPVEFGTRLFRVRRPG